MSPHQSGLSLLTSAWRSCGSLPTQPFFFWGLRCHFSVEDLLVLQVRFPIHLLLEAPILSTEGHPRAELEPLGGYSWTLAYLMVPSLSESSEEPGTRAIIRLTLHNRRGLGTKQALDRCLQN